ncbi:hypothetical protein, partial [Acinetobacter haemolyticus]|uniref:hypothetical protein n=1 Tax=Acinetobacter haemolyticus TaxID=29430 RepID=UPI00148EF20A
YNLKKWQNLIILISSIFTFSLAFYLLTVLGMLFVYLIDKRIKSMFFLIFGVFISSSFMLSIESFRFVVLDRLGSFDESLARRSGILLNEFYDEFSKSVEFFYGKPLNFLTNNRALVEGQSYKFFLIEYGVIGVFLILLLYLYFVFKSRNFFAIMLFLIFCISFIQRPFLFTPWQIMLFVMICRANST